MSEITYSKCGDYYLPNIVLRESLHEQIEPLGRYAIMRRAFLREHRRITYCRLIMTEQLYPHLRETDEAAAHRITVIKDREMAHEIILSELVYCQ